MNVVLIFLRARQLKNITIYRFGMRKCPEVSQLEIIQRDNDSGAVPVKEKSLIIDMLGII